MASPASRLLLQKNFKSFPLHLFRGPLSAASSSTHIAVPDPATTKPSTLLPVFPLNHLSVVGAGCDKQGILGLRFVDGYPGATLGRLEARGKKIQISDDEEEKDEFDDDENVDWDDDEDDDDDEEDFDYSGSDDDRPLTFSPSLSLSLSSPPSSLHSSTSSPHSSTSSSPHLLGLHSSS